MNKATESLYLLKRLSYSYELKSFSMYSEKKSQLVYDPTDKNNPKYSIAYI